MEYNPCNYYVELRKLDRPDLVDHCSKLSDFLPSWLRTSPGPVGPGRSGANWEENHRSGLIETGGFLSIAKPFAQMGYLRVVTCNCRLLQYLWSYLCCAE